ncbi:MAG: HEAT repeat domain-containing protein [Methanosarcinales archaeon]|nr:HEAT repeat domain-containing protein [Methanosarcinales archaeon]
MESQEDDVNSLIAVLKHEKDSHVRAKAVEALGKIGDARVVEPLMQALKDEHWDVRRKAVWALGNMGEIAVEPLMQALKDEHWDVRRKAAWALGNIGDVRGVEPLIHALRDEYADVREDAAWALGNIGDARSVEPLIHALRDEYADVRRQAARSLAALTVLNEEIVKAMIHDCESKLELEEHEREDFQKIKRLYEQEHKRLRTERSG